MLEVGNSPDFACERDAASLARCRVHFTQWCMLKALLLIGNNMSAITPATLGVLSNAEAIAVSQDLLGVQGRRVASTSPANATLTAPWDSIAVASRCDATRPTQAWHWVNESDIGPPITLFQLPCAPADPAQQWSFASGTLRNIGSGLCIDAALSPPGCSTLPAKVAPCNASSPSQRWTLLPQGQIAQGGECMDIPYGVGPQVSVCSCHRKCIACHRRAAPSADTCVLAPAYSFLPSSSLSPPSNFLRMQRRALRQTRNGRSSARACRRRARPIAASLLRLECRAGRSTRSMLQALRGASVAAGLKVVGQAYPATGGE